ncbi:lysozyme inhibitor LprI family protein [Pedosphaera parvula]|uniref:Lysozyme inhibitor LprI-like N-terminal domain-containing protein n=1 Tax=Pedosphaera parvula (strain Ellin514) TaxID=320771 RepID=B9XBD8_PEDPL|nr:lysozyme inhibitor LprI family protein [Pedosphaera parvula]EEF62823.1 protein of unknown function DUF1311 [Pedosphaera parvula Ellin514]
MRTIIAFLCLFLTVAALAGEPSDSNLQQLKNNLDQAKTQTETNLTSKAIADFWDAKLLRTERKIESRLNRQEHKKFLQTKKLWQKYRSSEVSFRAGFSEGGSIQPLIANSTYSHITEHRVIELEALYTDALAGRASPR